MDKTKMPDDTVTGQNVLIAEDWEGIKGEDMILKEFLRDYHPYSELIDPELIDPHHLSKPYEEGPTRSSKHRPVRS